MKEIKREFTLKSFSFPLKSQRNLSYYKTLTKGFDLFEKKIEKISEENPITLKIKQEIENIKINNSKILSIISSYLLGNSGIAYEILVDLLEERFYKERISKLIETNNSFSNSDSKLLRVRVSRNLISSREEMFHIPFSKRHLVANQRFSIAGLPCLYLGSSIYVCWLELGRKDFGELWVTGYKAQNRFNILNLAYDLNIIIRQFEKNEINSEQFVNYFMLWPLVMACSFQVKYPDAPFHEEYIIPSLLLQWITYKNKDIVGLKYLSTKLENYDNHSYGINYVFPPIKITKEYDYCPKLSEMFKITNPLSWELMSILPPADVAVHGSGIKAENLEEALLKNYDISRFGYIEEQVFSMDFENIKNIKNTKVANKGNTHKGYDI